MGRLRWLETVGSTNDEILSLADYHGAVCVAGEQTRGRGRRGRHWDSNRDVGIYLSMGWNLDGINAAGLSLVCGLAVRDALLENGVENVLLKWPNDVLLGGAKLAGILVELAGPRCVIGVGLNVTLAASPAAPVDAGNGASLPRTDLAAHGYHIDPDLLTATLIIQLSRNLVAFCREGFAPFAGRWNASHAFHGELVEIIAGDTVTGRVTGVDVDGGLRVDTAGGPAVFHAGEVSMKPLTHGR